MYPTSNWIPEAAVTSLKFGGVTGSGGGAGGVVGPVGGGGLELLPPPPPQADMSKAPASTTQIHPEPPLCGTPAITAVREAIAGGRRGATVVRRRSCVHGRGGRGTASLLRVSEANAWLIKEFDELFVKGVFAKVLGDYDTLLVHKIIHRDGEYAKL